MSRMPWAMYLWPGLPQLWTYGLWSGLVLAIGFGVLVNLLLAASFVWVELVSSDHLRLGWLATAALWGVSAVITLRWKINHTAPRAMATAEALFREALSEYLQGNWFEAESRLNQLLGRWSGDVEARLLLATLLRHTRRHDAAGEQLERLERLKDAEHWKQEIAAERRWNDEARTADAVRVAAETDTPSEDSRQAA
jgi:hypothetical protein